MMLCALSRRSSGDLNVSIIAELKRRNVLRVAAAYVVVSWLVVQVVETIFPAFGFDDASIRLVVIILAIGLIPVVIAAWVLELTPEGLRRDRSLAGQRPISSRTGRWIDAAIMITLALALGYFALDKFVISVRTTAQGSTASIEQTPGDFFSKPSLVVLPFANLSADAAQDYLSDGLAEELINLLARVPQLRVISRTSAFAFRNQELPVSDLARKLNVDYVLEGSVRKSGNRLRITAQLIDASTDSHLWSETFDRTVGDIFAIQDEIARSVLPNLQIRLLGSAPTVTESNPDAYALYLQALHFYQQRSAAGLDLAIAHVQRSIDIDPDYAPSWTLLASAYINQVNRLTRPLEEGFELASQAADEAISVDGDYALAHSVKAWISMAYERNYEASAVQFRKARSISPNNSVVLTNSSVLAIRLGRLDAARDMIERSLALDPTSTVAYTNLAEILLRSGQLADAERFTRQAIDLSPGNGAARSLLALILIVENRPLDAIEIVGSIENPAAREMILAMANHDLGDNESAGESLERLAADHADSAAYYLAIAYAWCGMIDESFAWLNRAIDEGQSFFGVRTEVFLNDLHADPRWEEVLSKAGLSGRQTAHIVI
jgi:TolB-like protein/Flp pilus assembly protein TadD